jgi:hypothetical protein
MYSPFLQLFAFNTSSTARLLRDGFLFLALALAPSVVMPTARAVIPAPDGGYSNQNTAEGTDALFSSTTGFGNTATGFNALFHNTTGSVNVASGAYALAYNTTGYDNVASGAYALYGNTTGYYNVASGAFALNGNTTGLRSTAIGFEALASNKTGSNHTATGFQALFDNTTGIRNTANGLQALFHNTTGDNNIALGYRAGMNLTTGNNNIDIGASGLAGEANTIRIGKAGTQTRTFVAGIRGVTVASGVGVIIGTDGQLGTVTSSARFKEAIKPMDKASEAILALQPVTFRYKQELDPYGIPQFGLVAEQVEKVNPNLVVRGADWKVNSVRYEAVNAMLLNEFLKEHKKVEEQGAMIAQQQKQIEALIATVRKVSERVEISAPAPQMAANED